MVLELASGRLAQWLDQRRGRVGAGKVRLEEDRGVGRDGDLVGRREGLVEVLLARVELAHQLDGAGGYPLTIICEIEMRPVMRVCPIRETGGAKNPLIWL